jgi:hypothetical protein
MLHPPHRTRALRAPLAAPAWRCALHRDSLWSCPYDRPAERVAGWRLAGIRPPPARGRVGRTVEPNHARRLRSPPFALSRPPCRGVLRLYLRSRIARRARLRARGRQRATFHRGASRQPPWPRCLRLAAPRAILVPCPSTSTTVPRAGRASSASAPLPKRLPPPAASRATRQAARSRCSPPPARARRRRSSRCPGAADAPVAGAAAAAAIRLTARGESRGAPSRPVSAQPPHAQAAGRGWPGTPRR